MIPQAQRVKVFAGGFFIGCIIAAAIALYRAAGEEGAPLPPLTTFEVTTADIPLPELPFPHPKPFKTWTSPETTETRWLVQDQSENLWRVSQNGDAVQIFRANELQVDGNPGIETPALRAGLEHNGFEILSFDPLTTIFTVAINPFDANSIEKNARLLVSREPYILGAGPIPFGTDKLTRFDTNLN